MPFRSTLTMARLEFCQLLIKIVLFARRQFLSHYHNLASPIDFHARDMHTCRSDRLHRPGHVLLPECGGRAGHGSYREILLSAVIEVRSEVMRGESPSGPSAGLLWQR